MPEIMTAVGVSTAWVAFQAVRWGNKKPHFLHEPWKTLGNLGGLRGSFEFRCTGGKPEGADRPRGAHQAVSKHAALFAIGGGKLELCRGNLGEEEIEHLALQVLVAQSLTG